MIVLAELIGKTMKLTELGHIYSVKPYKEMQLLSMLMKAKHCGYMAHHVLQFGLL